MIIISCDPGKTGAVVVLEGRKLLSVIPVPLKDMAVDCFELYVRLDSLIDFERPPNKCCIEFVHAMPAQGVSSSFSFGKTTGMLEAILSLFDDEGVVTPIRSQAWKKHFKLIKTTKEDAVALALEMCPELFNGLDKKPNKQIQSGIADAYLIGKYYEFMLSQQETD